MMCMCVFVWSERASERVIERKRKREREYIYTHKL